MRDFACSHCGQRLAFENVVCLACSDAIGSDRSMGHADLHPFALSPLVLEKMRLVHHLGSQATP